MHGKCHPEIASEEVHARFVVRILRVTSLSLVPQGTGYLDACLRDKAKLRRAYGECLGSQRRRRTWTAAISSGEPLTGYDPGISEWGNPNADEACACGEFITTRGEREELKHLSTRRKRKKHRFS